ncbi:MAG: hypothetical protein JWR61_1084 [Ferruginibacter sp.]|nr:hypothetical protein [Ferruginibacter sp.]
MLKPSYSPPGEPVSFEYQGKKYTGILSKVSVAGHSNVWYLMVNKYYWGTLSYTSKWVFHNPKNDMQDLAEFFGGHVVKSEE